MSRYTVQFRYILENPDWTDERLGLANYPIFDESYRSHLNNLIKEYFYFDEIGFETPARFAFKLKNYMLLKMPFFNKMYESALLEFNPLINMGYSVDKKSTLQEILNTIKNQNADTNKSGNGNTIENNSSNTSSIESLAKSDKNDNVGSNISERNENTQTEEQGLRNESKNENSIKNNYLSENGLENKKIEDSEKSSDKTTRENSSSGLSVTSDTPEGFLLTSSIENSTYANTGNKTKNSSDETLNKTSSGNKASSVNGSSVKNTNAIDSVSNLSAINSSGNKNSNSIIIDSNNVLEESTGTSESGSNKVGTNSETSEKVVDTITSDIISEIVTALENKIRNLDNSEFTAFNGFSGSTLSKMLLEWRETFINVDEMVLNSLEHLFLGVLN